MLLIEQHTTPKSEWRTQASSAQMETLKELFYKSQVNHLLGALETIESSESIINNTIDFALLKANCLFEKNNSAEAAVVLKKVVEELDHRHDDIYLHTLARLAYLDSKYTEAEELFMEVIENAETEIYQFKSLLGLANVYYSRGSAKELEYLVSDLLQFDLTKVGQDDMISLEIFLGNYKSKILKNYGGAAQHYQKAIKFSAPLGWNYFISRSLFGLANVYKESSQSDKLDLTLSMLDSFYSKNETPFFNELVQNTFFQGKEKDAPFIMLDETTKSVCLLDSWMAFHDKPKIFTFFELLAKEADFVSKRQIAEFLWEDEIYKPRVHDPRIFDIAKRVRQVIAPFSKDGLTMLSGRLGYKLIRQ